MYGHLAVLFRFECCYQKYNQNEITLKVKQMNFVDFRCGVCNKLLARVKGDAQIKCPRCSSMNLFNDNILQVIDNRKDNQPKIAIK